ncbi:MAG: hypothetical protein ACE5DM_00125 [Candidatus Nanoarchaeia archaeon]
MIELVYSPKWFYGKDIVIDLVSILVLSLIAFFSIRCYRINRNKKHLLLASSFILMALAFMFKIITNFTIYYHVVETRQWGLLTLAYSSLRASSVLFIIGFFVYRILMLLGLYVLHSTYTKQSRANIVLVLYLLLVSTYFSSSAYYMFHVTALVLLSIITLTYHSNYKKSRHETNRLLFYSFSMITLSQLVFIFIEINPVLYVIADLIQLTGYAGLLITFIKVLKDGKKKRKK